MILSTLMIVLSLQTKIGEKVSIISERAYELWEGKSSTTNNKKNQKKNTNQNNVKVSQPISQGQQKFMQPQQTRVYADSTSINSLPTHEMTGSTNMLNPQQTPNFNAMYSQQDNTPLVNAATPGQSTEGFMEPMAASDALGGSWGGFSSW